MEIAKTNKFLVVAVTLLFFTLSFLGISHHELWLDEAHHWLLARDSNSLVELYRNTRYEGHPILWNVLTYLLSRFSTNPWWMQLTHIVISSTAVFIFLKYTPFKIWFKLLFIFGYFTLYEYNIISRNYALGLLFFFWAVSYFPSRSSKTIGISILLAFLCNTHAIFCIPAISYMFILIWEQLKTPHKKKLIISSIVFAAGAFLAFYQIIPPQDTNFFEKNEAVPIANRVAKSIYPFFKSVFVIPNVNSSHFWNSHILFDYNKMMAFGLACLSLITPLFLFWRNRILLSFMYLGIKGSFIFFFFTQLSAMRYFGVLYIMLIGTLWMQHYFKEAKTPSFPFIGENSFLKLKSILITTILLLQFGAGVFAYGMDLNKPFTNAQQVFSFLEDEKLLQNKIVTNACDGTPMSAYLEEKLFFIRFDSMQSYCNWNRLYQIYGKEQSLSSITASLKKQREAQSKSIIFISYRPLFELTKEGVLQNLGKNLNVQLLKKFEESIVPKGTYYIYEIDH